MVSFDNILFVPSVPGSEWVSETFPDRSPAELAALFLKTMPQLLLCLYSDESEKGE